ncbi:alpha/beta hydrolase [Cellulomonas xylanilytica]|uniref:Esterase n=1 Tax=Cellulomonas xylanilytica TaxID=233583 RepID=A0A510UZK9_9CELL|nr:alpha/beta hydrolase-fold protein [Cellulomonas xylanilytica]GEK20112.1 esterase [Cellulomonas xylanilytica]
MVRAVDPPGSTLPPHVLRQLAGGGDWIGSWWTVVVALALVVLVVLWAVRRRRADRWSWPLWAVAGLGAAFTVGIATNVVVGYVPDVTAARVALSSWGVVSPPAPLEHGTAEATSGGPRSGRVEAVHVPAPSADRMPEASLTWIYTPPGYTTTGSTRYPVVYLVHGSPGTGGDWFAAGNVPHAMDVLLENRLVEPMIVVGLDVNGTGPGAEDTECLDSTTGGSQVETYLSETVIPWVDARYRTLDDWEHRAIGGFSSGGFCALDQGLRHPELYGTILALDTTGDPGTGGQAMLATQAQWDQHDVTTYAASVPLPHPVALFADIAGANHGQNRKDLTSIAADLRARGQDVVVRVEPGMDHTWSFARQAIPYGLVFASAHLSGKS